MKTVRLMTDYCAVFPLWDEEGGTGAEDWPTHSEGLIHALEQWQDHWEHHFHHERGWIADGRAWHLAEGRRLAERTRAELGGGWELQLILD